MAFLPYRYDFKRVIAPLRELQEARNAIAAYEQLNNWKATNETHLLKAYAQLMQGLVMMRAVTAKEMWAL
jgi:hypothetical protein